MSDHENKEAVLQDTAPVGEAEKKEAEPEKTQEATKAEVDSGAGDAPAEEEEKKPDTNGKDSDGSEDEGKEEEDKEEAVEEKSGDEEEEELKPGLLEQPLVRSGKREKKKVERLTMSSPATEKKKSEIQDGKGTKLGDIPRVEFGLGKTLAENLKVVHRICFSRAGSSYEVKKNLRQFSGFPFIKGSQEYERKVQAVTKLNLSQIKAVCSVLDVEKKGLRDEIVERLMDFLMVPKATGKGIPQKTGKRSSTGQGKKSGTPGKRGRKPGSKNKKKESKSDDEAEDEEEASGEESEEEEKEKEKDEAEDSEEKEEKEESEEEEEEVEEVKKPPKKKAKKEEKPKKETKKESPRKPKKTPAKEAKEPKKDKKRKNEDEKSEAKKAKKPPNEDELKEVIKKILEGANLEEVTMKTLCKQVYAKYPDFDLTDKKDFIKSTVKQIIR